MGHSGIVGHILPNGDNGSRSRPNLAVPAAGDLDALRVAATAVLNEQCAAHIRCDFLWFS